MEISGVQHVQARIGEIQKRFGLGNAVAGQGAFQSILDSSLKKISPTVAESTTTKSTEETTMPKTDPHKIIRRPLEGRTPSSQAQILPHDTLESAGSKWTGKMDGPTEPLTSQYVEEAAQKYHVDPKLISAVMQAESNGNQAAISNAGAVGLMQLMPATAASLGVNPYDEKENVEGGAKYLKELLDTFGGDVRKAVAAYNAGPAAVQRYNGVPPYPETANYVNKVLDLYG